MYKMDYFTERDDEKVLAFMRAYPFAIICGTNYNGPVATHVPLDIRKEDDRMILTGHIMRNTDHHKAFVENDSVLVIFNGPDTYISANWYNNPHVASTWNYMTVHAKGKIVFGDEEDTLKIIEELTNQYEGTESEGAFKNLPTEYIQKLVKAIIGFTINISEVENVYKLSQNHEIENRRNIIAQLFQRGDEKSFLIAKEMESRINEPKQNR